MDHTSQFGMAGSTALSLQTGGMASQVVDGPQGSARIPKKVYTLEIYQNIQRWFSRICHPANPTKHEREDGVRNVNTPIVPPRRPKFHAHHDTAWEEDQSIQRKVDCA